MKEKIYKEPNKSETETTINVLYAENILSIYTNKVSGVKIDFGHESVEML